MGSWVKTCGLHMFSWICLRSLGKIVPKRYLRPKIKNHLKQNQVLLLFNVFCFEHTIFLCWFLFGSCFLSFLFVMRCLLDVQIHFFIYENIPYQESKKCSGFGSAAPDEHVFFLFGTSQISRRNIGRFSAGQESNQLPPLPF